MPRWNEVHVELPDASIEIEVFGNTVGWSFFFDLEERIQAGTAIIDNPEHRELVIKLLEAAIQLYREANWQTLYPDFVSEVSPDGKENGDSENESPPSGVNGMSPEDIPF